MRYRIDSSGKIADRLKCHGQRAGSIRARSCFISLAIAGLAWCIGSLALGTDGVVVHGGAGQVSGSMSILELGGHSWMVDCGTYYPESGSSAEEREALAAVASGDLPPAATQVDGVFLTHAHIDHIGRIPLMVREGYLRCTRPREPFNWLR